MNERAIAEYINLRNEILERAKLLHQLITTAVILAVIFLLNGFWLVRVVSQDQFIWYLLFIPLIFSLLTFNYQSNQMTMEAIARYVSSKKQTDDWDDFYGSYKRRVVLTSFLKVLPLLVPSLTAFVLIVTNPLTSSQLLMVVVDFFLFALVVFNFRYKSSVNLT